MQADPPFIGVELDISDSGREACSVSTLTITSEPKVGWRLAAVGTRRALRQQSCLIYELRCVELPAVFAMRCDKRWPVAELRVPRGLSCVCPAAPAQDWQGAIQVAVQELRRIQRFGITKGEQRVHSCSHLAPVAAGGLVLTVACCRSARRRAVALRDGHPSRLSAARSAGAPTTRPVTDSGLLAPCLLCLHARTHLPAGLLCHP